MANAEGFEFGVDVLHACLVEVFDAGAAVGGDEFEGGGVGLQDAWDEGAGLVFEVVKDGDFGFEAFLGLVAAKDFMHASIVADTDGGAAGVFDFLHEGGRRREKGERGSG